MAKFEDFSKYVYRKGELNTYNIGWLEGTRKINRGTVSNEFLNALWEYIKCPLRQTRGLYWNRSLDILPKYFKAVYEGREIPLGGSEIRVLDERNECIYAAPNLILHYIINHHYKPPEKFIYAVINGPKPKSKRYSEYIQSFYGLKEDFGVGRIKCPYCGKWKNDLLAPIKRNFEKQTQIKIVPISKKINKKSMEYDYIYPLLCHNCGNIFEANYEDIMWIYEESK